MKTLRTFLSSILVVGLSGFSIPSFADDTELYVQNNTPVINSSTRPNLLLIVDNSGSLLEEDIVTGKDANGRDIKSSRLNVLTDALLRVLDEAQNVNIGLERFTFHHGAGGNTPIIYPVSYIDEPVATSNISLDYKVQDGLDDAEEGLTNEPVIVGDKVIEMTRRVGTDILFGDKVVTTQVAIAENADDSRESLGNSKFYPPVGAETSVYSPVPAAGTNYPTAGPISSIANSIALGASVSQQQEEIVGLRFKNLNVPKNATILAASLEFTANATVLSNGCNCDGTPLNLQIKVEDADSANAFSASGNGTISSRTYSTTTVDWLNIPAWDHDQTYSSADVSTLLQGLVNKNQWSQTNNAVAFSLARTPLYNSSDFKNATGTNRRFYSASENISKAVVLKVVYTTDTTDPAYKTGAAAIPAQEMGQITQQIKDTNNDGFEYLGDMVTKVCKVGGTALSDTSSTDIRGFLGEGTCDISGQNEQTCWGKYLAGFRFENLSIPKNTTILKSSLEITSNGHDITSNYLSSKDLNLNIFLENNVNAPAFSGGSYLGSGDCVTPVTNKNLSNRISGTPVTWSNVPVVPSGGTWSNPVPVVLMTPDLSTLIQPLVNNSDWSSSNALAFLLQPDKNVIVAGKAGITGTAAQKTAELASVKENRVGSRRFYDYSDTSKGPSFAAKLKVTYGKAIPAATQQVGVRFQNVNVPKGATITNAYLTFGSGISTDGAANLTIAGQKSGDAGEFQEAERNISSRPKTGATTSWNASSTIPLSAWTEGQTYRTPELKNVVQEIVNQTDWCGGNSMGFVVTSTDNTSVRNVVSFDASPDLAPALHIEFDPNTIPSTTCVNQTYTTVIKDSADDGFETIVRANIQNNFVELSNSWDDRVLPLTNTTYAGTKTKRMVGVRFPDIPLQKGQEIISAELTFTATAGKLNNEDTTANGSAQTSQASLVVVGEKGSAKQFEEITGNFSGRSKTSTAVNWTIPATQVWKENRKYSANVTNIVKEIVNLDSWETYGNLAFFVTASDDLSLRKAASFDLSPTIAPVLQIKIRGLLGSGFAQTARQFMKNQVLLMKKSVYELAKDDGEFTGAYTPTVDSLYEGALYYRGEVVSGSANNRRNKQYFMVSYPTSHDKPIVFSQSHTNADGTPKCSSSLPDYPFSEVCASEKLDNTQPPGRYYTPIKQGCQANHIVLISDGLPTKNTVAGTIIGGGSSKPAVDRKVCTDKKGYRADPPITTPKQDCTDFLDARDAETTTSMANITCEKLPEVYKEFDPTNKGNYGQDHKCGPELAAFLANNKQLTSLDSSTVKTHTIGLKLVGAEAPAEAYLKAIAKSGKGSYYRADTADELLLAFQTIIATAMSDSSSFASPAVSVNVFNRLYHNNEIYFTFFKPSNTVAWEGNVKRYNLCTDKTGCPSSIVGKGKTAAIGGDGSILATAQDVWSTLSEPDGPKVLMAGAGGVLPAPDSRNIYTNTVGDTAIALTDAVNAVASTNSSLTDAMLNVATEANPAAARTELINWIRGYTDATAGTVREWRFGDPLHSTPAVFTYGQDSATKTPKTKVIVNTNEGAIRMLDGGTGVEDWMFIPKDMLKIQKDLKANASSPQRLYGIDGRPVVWVRDNNYDGKIEGTDSVWVFTGMRRGGRNVYALQVTPDTSNPPAHKPRLMWTIFGGQNSEQGDFSKLGQTWSTPIITKVMYNGAPKTVLLFGGGFDATTQDVTANYQQQATMGNTIYMVDPLDGGKLLWSAGSANNTSAALKLTGMNYSFPSDLTVFDGDGDGLVDRIYVGDTGGQLWRIDIRDVAKGYAVGGRLAALGESLDAGKRRFFYPPDVARLTDVKYSPYATDFDLVLIGSGHRPNPLNKTIQDRLYAFRDRQTDWLIGNANGGKSGEAVQDTPAFLDQTVAGGSAQAATKFFTIKEDKLYDATAEVLNSSTDQTTLDGAKETIKKSLGWKVELANLAEDGAKAFVGEKALAKPLVLNGVAYYTTFTPPQPKTAQQAQTVDACQPTADLGTAKSYAINILTGEGSNPSKKRAEEIGGSIPAEPIAVFTPNGVKVYASVGSGKVGDPTSPPAIKEIGEGGSLPRETVYWLEE